LCHRRQAISVELVFLPHGVADKARDDTRPDAIGPELEPVGGGKAILPQDEATLVTDEILRFLPR